MGKRSSAARKKAGAKARITAKQKSARVKNIAIARKAKPAAKGGGAKKTASGFGSGKRVTKADRKSLEKRANRIINREAKKSPNVSLRGIAKRSKTFANIQKSLSTGKW